MGLVGIKWRIGMNWRALAGIGDEIDLGKVTYYNEK